jgi:hypothetical protein
MNDKEFVKSIYPEIRIYHNNKGWFCFYFTGPYHSSMVFLTNYCNTEYDAWEQASWVIKKQIEIKLSS